MMGQSQKKLLQYCRKAETTGNKEEWDEWLNSLEELTREMELANRLFIDLCKSLTSKLKKGPFFG